MEVMTLLFHEIYGSYFRVVTAVLEEAIRGTLTTQRLGQLVREQAFAESVLTIPTALQSGEWLLLDDAMGTPLHSIPKTPLTILEKRWLKALLLDPRVRLFQPPEEGLEDIEPLFTPDMFVYFDRYTDGDPYEEPGYIERFQTVLTALREKRKLSIQFDGRHGHPRSWVCVPYRLEYSAKDDKFRLLTAGGADSATINLGRITGCELSEPYSPQAYHPPQPQKETLVLELFDQRNALERAMLHFSHLEKETERLENRKYRITLRYNREDETELLIRVLSFGPMLRVIAPDSFLAQVKSRLGRQKSCEL